MKQQGLPYPNMDLFKLAEKLGKVSKPFKMMSYAEIVLTNFKSFVKIPANWSLKKSAVAILLSGIESVSNPKN